MTVVGRQLGATADIVVAHCDFELPPAGSAKHEWFFDIEYKKTRYSMRVNEYAALHGATRPVTSKQEAREVWEPLYTDGIARVAAGVWGDACRARKHRRPLETGLPAA